MNQSVLPERFEAVGRKLGVANRMLDVLVPEVRLKRPGVVALGCQCETASVPQHVWVKHEGVSVPAQLGDQERDLGAP